MHKMRFNLSFLGLVACLHMVSLAADITKNSTVITTKLYPKHSLGSYKPSSAKAKSLGGEAFTVYYDEEQMKVVVLGRHKSGKKIVTGFLRQQKYVDQLQAIFIVRDEMAREVIQDLLEFQSPEEMRAVLIVKDANADRVFADLMGGNDQTTRASAILVARDREGSALARRLLDHKRARKQVEVVLLGRDLEAVDFIQDFLEKHDHNEELKMALIGKDDNAPQMVNKLLQTDETEEEMKVVLVGKEQKARYMVSALLDNTDPPEGISMQVMGDGDRAQNMIDSILDMSSEEEKVDVVLFNKDGDEQILSPAGFARPPVVPFKAIDINEELLGKDTEAVVINNALTPSSKQGLHCASDAIKNKTDMVSASLDQFTNRLKHFVSGNKFDFRGFELWGPELERSLVSMRDAVADISECNRAAAEKFSVARKSFEVMVTAIESLEHYSSSRTPGHTLIFNVIELFVRLLSLRDSHGDPDPSIENYSNIVIQSIQMLNSWGLEFKKYAHMPFGKQKMFKKFFGKTEAALIAMARSVERNDESMFSK